MLEYTTFLNNSLLTDFCFNFFFKQLLKRTFPPGLLYFATQTSFENCLFVSDLFRYTNEFEILYICFCFRFFVRTNDLLNNRNYELGSKRKIKN